MNRENDYWYNIDEKDGHIIVEKREKEVNFTSIEKQNKKSKLFLKIFLTMIIFISIIVMGILYFNMDSHGKKYRTFMIYMVGSDLESDGSIATYDLNDIKPSKIDLKNNNILLLVGGSKKWHNFVDSNEIGLYELKSYGFKKIKSYPISSMGDIKTLSNFLNYAHDNFKSEKYDLIFWNHGLGAVGLEDDEVSNDYINIVELNNVFKDTPFEKEKLELVIFNNCLSGNLHFASIMSNYSDYMVASEEVMYVGSKIDRLNFLENVEKEDNGYDIGLSYIEKSDSSLDKLNNKNKNKKEYDSTLSIYDLNKMNDLEESVNDFFSSINLNDNYRNISIARYRTYSYGENTNYQYDTTDLYELVNNLSDYSTSDLTEKVKENIDSLVLYNSAINNHSNGISIYFPFFGSANYINTHLYYFEKIWDNSYTKFINEFHEQSSNVKKAHRSGSIDNINHLTNNIVYLDNNISIDLTEEEKDNYQRANIYILEKNNDEYKLVLKSDDLKLNENKLSLNKFEVLKTNDDKIVSSIYNSNKYKVYGKNDTDIVINITNNNGKGEIDKILLDSDNKSINGVVENENLDSLYDLYIDIYKDNIINEDYKIEKKEQKEQSIINNDLFIKEEKLNGYYVLIELFDINNDTYYSNFMKVE